MIFGKVFSGDKRVVDYATVYLKGTNYGGTTNEQGLYYLNIPSGKYILVVSAVGYKTVEQPVKLLRGEHRKINITLQTQI